MLPWELYEDAATGSAAGSLGAYLVKNGKLGAGHTLHIMQGAEMGRPSQIEVEVTQTGTKLIPRVSGAAVRVFEGNDSSAPYELADVSRQPHCDSAEAVYFLRLRFARRVQNSIHERARVISGKLFRQSYRFIDDQLLRASS